MLQLKETLERKFLSEQCARKTKLKENIWNIFFYFQDFEG